MLSTIINILVILIAASVVFMILKFIFKTALSLVFTIITISILYKLFHHFIGGF